MKFLHTSDFHLGLRLCEYPMNTEIEYLLNQITQIAENEKCTAVIVAGDIYDRSNPSPESVAIFDDFVTNLADRGIHTFIISGNHDSPERIAYLSHILKGVGVHVSPVFDGKITKTTIEDGFGRVNFYMMPFFRPSQLRTVCTDFTRDGFTEACRFAVGLIGIDTEERNIMMTHHFVIGTSKGDSESDELDVEVGESGAVSADVFADFDYTALGHLHGAHHVGEIGHIEYSGSPLKCSFAESGDEKSVNLVEMGEKGDVTVRKIPLHPLHDLREIRGSYDFVTSLECRSDGNPDDFLRIILTDEDDIPDAVAKLRTIYPNLMRLSYDNLRTRKSQTIDITSDESGDILIPESVFAELYELQNNSDPDDSIMAIVGQLFDISRKGAE